MSYLCRSPLGLRELKLSDTLLSILHNSRSPLGLRELKHILFCL